MISITQIINENLNSSWLLGLIFNPFFFARQGLLKEIKKHGRTITGQTLDIGCGVKPYKNIFFSDCYFGVEVYDGEDDIITQADCFYDGYSLPFKSEAFDSIVCNQVLEHVFEPVMFLEELRRILKMNGIVILTVPFIWDEHEQPYDYARYTSYGLKYILEQTGFKILLQKKSVKDIRVIFQMLNTYVYKLFFTKSKIINLLLTVFIIFPSNLIGSILSLLLPKNDDMYLDNIFLLKKE